MRFVAVGAGGIGGLIAAWMARAGYDVTIVDRWAEHVASINDSGLIIDGVRGVHRIRVAAITPDALSTIAPLDVVVVAVKSQDTRAALEQLLPHSMPQTTFVSMQAGFNAFTFEALVGRERTIVANPHFGGALVAPGHLEAGFPNYIWIGEWGGQFTPRLRALQLALSAYTPTFITNDIWGAVLSKFSFGFETILTSISDRPSGQTFAEAKYKHVAAALVGEALAMTSALGVSPVGFDFFDPAPYRDAFADNLTRLTFWMSHAWPRHEVFRANGFHRFRKTGSGMRFDRQHRKQKSEATARMPALRNLASTAGVTTPMIDALMEMVEEIEDGHRPATQANLDELHALLTTAARTHTVN